MVGPILISVAVTPRISAAIEAQGKVSTASAPSLVTKRIDASPRLFRRAQTATAAGAVRPRSPHAETCHDGRMDANRNHYETEAKKQLVATRPGLFRSLAPLVLRNDELQSRPDIIDRTDLDVDEA